MNAPTWIWARWQCVGSWKRQAPELPFSHVPFRVRVSMEECFHCHPDPMSDTNFDGNTICSLLYFRLLIPLVCSQIHKNFWFSIVFTCGLCDLPKYKINGWIYSIHCGVSRAVYSCVKEYFLKFWIVLRFGRFCFFLVKISATHIRNLSGMCYKWFIGCQITQIACTFQPHKAHTPTHINESWPFSEEWRIRCAYVTIIVAWKHNSFCLDRCACVWSSTSQSKVTEIAIVAYLTLVNDNALWIWQIDSLPFQIINRLCAMVWSKCSLVGSPTSWIMCMPPMMICTNAYTLQRQPPQPRLP